MNLGIGGGTLKSAIPCDFMMSLIELILDEGDTTSLTTQRETQEY
jgi:hypothetical protein